MENNDASQQRPGEPYNPSPKLKDSSENETTEDEEHHTERILETRTELSTEQGRPNALINEYSACQAKENNLLVQLFPKSALVYRETIPGKGFLQHSSLPHIIPPNQTNIICFGAWFLDDDDDDWEPEPPPPFSPEERQRRDNLTAPVDVREVLRRVKEARNVGDHNAGLASSGPSQIMSSLPASGSMPLPAVGPDSLVPPPPPMPVNNLASSALPIIQTTQPSPTANGTYSSRSSDNAQSNTSQDNSTAVVESVAHSSGTDSSLDSVSREKYHQQLKKEKEKNMKGKWRFLSCFG